MMSPEKVRLWSIKKASGRVSSPSIQLLLKCLDILDLKYRIKWPCLALAPFCYKTSFILIMGKILIEIDSYLINIIFHDLLKD